MPNYLPGSTLEVGPRRPEQTEALLRSLFLAGGQKKVFPQPAMPHSHHQYAPRQHADGAYLCSFGLYQRQAGR